MSRNTPVPSPLYAPEGSPARAGREKLPEWDLTDLFPAPDSPELAKTIAASRKDCQAFEKRHQGTLADLDGDGVGNNADSDSDGDGVDNVSDAFPRDASETLDTDNDEIGNSADTDDDNDGVSDTWTVAQLGSDIDGEAANDLASRIALSGDGTTLAVGSWGANSYTGFVRIFKWNSSSAD